MNWKRPAGVKPEMSSGGERARLLCPSARPEWTGARVIGVVTGTVSEPEVRYLERPLPVLDSVLAMTAPVTPTEVLRFAAPCVQRACRHFQHSRCHLVEKVVAGLDPVVSDLPPCSIRDDCRWFAEEGAAACWRCPQVVTDAPPLDRRMIAITDPTV
jgi:hypothetical protein